jgi:hypothetical protein
MPRSTGRLSTASDDWSISDWSEGAASKTLEGPAATLWGGGPGAGNTGRGTCRHHTATKRMKVPTMAKRTRGPSPSDSETRTSAVKITPVSSISATVPTIQPVA